jgi:type IV secretory pathway VirB10-like protein
MEISRGAVGIVAAVCVAVGAGGAYFATRTSEPTQAASTESESKAPAVSPDPAAPSVEQSEALVAEAPAPAPPSTATRNPRTPAPVTRTPSRPRHENVASTRPSGSNESPTNRTTSANNKTPAAKEEVPVAPPVIETARVSETVPSEPPAPRYEDVIVPAQSVIGLQLESSVTSEKARVEDEVVARVTRDVKVGDRVAIPAGSRAQGEVTLVERGGKVRERARLGVRFTSIVLADGTRLPIQTETIFREGDSPTGESAAKIGGGAIGGAILGGILGGAKGAAIGGSVGAGAGSAAVLAGGRNAATLSSGAPVTVRTEEPVTVTVEK